MRKYLLFLLLLIFACKKQDEPQKQFDLNTLSGTRWKLTAIGNSATVLFPPSQVNMPEQSWQFTSDSTLIITYVFSASGPATADSKYKIDSELGLMQFDKPILTVWDGVLQKWIGYEPIETSADSVVYHQHQSGSSNNSPYYMKFIRQ